MIINRKKIVEKQMISKSSFEIDLDLMSKRDHHENFFFSMSYFIFLQTEYIEKHERNFPSKHIEFKRSSKILFNNFLIYQVM